MEVADLQFSFAKAMITSNIIADNVNQSIRPLLLSGAKGFHTSL